MTGTGCLGVVSNDPFAMVSFGYALQCLRLTVVGRFSRKEEKHNLSTCIRDDHIRAIREGAWYGL